MFKEKQKEKAFQTAKETLQTDSLLVHYDPAKPLMLACDASQCKIGAVLFHVTEDQQESDQSTYGSRMLTGKNYSQLEKEALAIIFAMKKFHNYICWHVDALHNCEIFYSLPKPPQNPESGDSDDDLFLLDISAATLTLAVPTAESVQPVSVHWSIAHLTIDWLDKLWS